MTFIRSQGRQLVYHAGLGIGFASTATAITKSPPSITDAFMLQNSRLGPDQFSQRYAYRPNQPTIDRINKTDQLSGATLSMSGPDYLDDTDMAWELVGLLHPDELNECIRLAIRLVYFKNRSPVTYWDDGDFSDSGVGFWPTLSGATRAKVSSPVDTGFLALQVTNSAGNGYVQGNPKNVTPGEDFYHAAIGQVTGAGTGVYQLVNYDTGAVLEQFTITDTDWQHVHDVTRIPAGCERVAVRLGALENGTVTTWDCLPSHSLWNRRPPAPANLDEDWKLIEFSNGLYGRTISATQDKAASRVYEAWHRSERALDESPPEVNAQRWHLTRGDAMDPLPRNDLWIHSFRPYSDRGTMENETDITYAPEEYFSAAIFLKVAELCMRRYPEEPSWKTLYDTSDAKLLAQRLVRAEEPPPSLYEVQMSGGRL